MRKNYLNYYMLFKQKRNESFYLYIYTTQHNIECSENDEKKTVETIIHSAPRL